MGLEIAEEDFYEWYWEVMKPHSPYVVKEGDKTKGKKRVLQRGRGRHRQRFLSMKRERMNQRLVRVLRQLVGRTAALGLLAWAKERGPPFQ